MFDSTPLRSIEMRRISPQGRKISANVGRASLFFGNSNYGCRKWYDIKIWDQWYLNTFTDDRRYNKIIINIIFCWISSKSWHGREHENLKDKNYFHIGPHSTLAQYLEIEYYKIYVKIFSEKSIFYVMQPWSKFNQFKIRKNSIHWFKFSWVLGKSGAKWNSIAKI